MFFCRGRPLGTFGGGSESGSSAEPLQQFTFSQAPTSQKLCRWWQRSRHLDLPLESSPRFPRPRRLQQSCAVQACAVQAILQQSCAVLPESKSHGGD